MKTYCFALDLKDDPDSIQEYKKYHEHVWPEVKKTIIDSGITDLQIYCTGNRLFMITEVDDSFSWERKEKLDQTNPKVQEWEKLMWKFQKALPTSNPNEKWILMEKICHLKKK